MILIGKPKKMVEQIYKNEKLDFSVKFHLRLWTQSLHHSWPNKDAAA